MKFLTFLKRFHKDNLGAATTEYSVQLALVLIIAMSAIRLMGTESSKFYERNASGVESAFDGMNSGGSGATN